MPFESVPLTISYHLCFLRISKVWGMLHNGSVGRVQSKQCYFMFTYTFLVLFCLFSSKNCVFIIFISFFDEVSSFRNRILTNQKPELVIRNCQWLFVRISSQTKWSGVIFSWKPQHDKHLEKLTLSCAQELIVMWRLLCTSCFIKLVCCLPSYSN